VLYFDEFHNSTIFVEIRTICNEGKRLISTTGERFPFQSTKADSYIDEQSGYF